MTIQLEHTVTKGLEAAIQGGSGKLDIIGQ